MAFKPADLRRRFIQFKMTNTDNGDGVENFFTRRSKVRTLAHTREVKTV